MICKFCGKEIPIEKYLHTPEFGICANCSSYCHKKCELGKSGSVQGWHFEPCLSCEKNPYKWGLKNELR